MLVLGGEKDIRTIVSGESNRVSNSLPYVGMTVNKTESANIFVSSDAAKKVVDDYLKKPEYQDY